MSSSILTYSSFIARGVVSIASLLSFAGVLYLWFVAPAGLWFPCNALYCTPPPPPTNDILTLFGAQILAIFSLAPIAVVGYGRLWPIGVISGVGLEVALHWYVFTNPANPPIIAAAVFSNSTTAIVAAGLTLVASSLVIGLSDYRAERASRHRTSATSR
ncbi:MAG: hypothetical protein ABSB90_07800 [Thermoplasmata archaeon]